MHDSYSFCYFCIRLFKLNKVFIMKKIQMMFAVVLVAFMAMAVQSCGSDKDDSTHNLTVKLTVVEKGELTDDMVQKLEKDSNKSENANYGSDELAADATELAAKTLAAQFESLTGADALNTAIFTVRITCKNIKNNRVISEWLVTWDKGEVDYTVANK